VRILISAYACEPGRGSELGTGWNWAVAAAHNHDVVVLTRANNRGVIERGLESLDDAIRSRLSFEYVDLPDSARRWKKGGFGIRAYYYVWQVLAWQRARELAKVARFDLIHHSTFANIWLPALTCLSGVPFVFGPVSGGQRVPVRLYATLGPRSTLLESSLLLARRASRLNPLVQIGLRRASIIVVNNRETYAAIPRRYRQKVLLRTQAVAETTSTLSVRPRSDAPPVAVCAGRLSPFKGVSLAIRALTDARDWHLIVIGDGSERRNLELLARRLGVADRVQFVATVPQEDLWKRLAHADALILPSLKEGASFIAVEAQALGLPVVALDQGGPAALALSAPESFRLVRPGSTRETARGLAAALHSISPESPPMPTSVFGRERLVADVDTLYAMATSPQSEWSHLVRKHETAIMLPGEAWER
jgi:glycosyltransferase involved in cell wall biosynthesis